jgi:predicted nucleic acid-binding protein
MTGRAFVDTNVLVYAVGPASRKREQAEALLLSLEEAVVSPQVISEFVSVCLRKQVLPPAEVRQAAEDFMDVFRLEPLGEGTLRRGLAVRERYGLSWWDSLIVAAALEGDCDVLYSEDFQAGQVVEGRLRIESPFT